MGGVWRSLAYAAIGGISVAAGGTLAVFRPPRDRTRALFQHAAAGTVLAGLVVDVLAKLIHRPEDLTVIAVGMVVGLGGMVAIRVEFPPGEGTDQALAVTIAVDIAVDGVLIGLSAGLGSGTSLVFAVALAPEMGLLGATAAHTLRDRCPGSRVITLAALIGSAITAAGALGWVVATAGGSMATSSVLGAGASVLMYLVLEELLREAHDTTVGTTGVAVLFGAFLPLFLAGIALG